jgi:hypothetical protein
MLPRALRLSCARTQIPRTQFAKSVLSQFQAHSYVSPPSAPPVELKKTPLHDFHVAAGAKMVPFAGYSMPVTYADQGLSESHAQVRTKAGLFDVSHMVQHRYHSFARFGRLNSDDGAGSRAPDHLPSWNVSLRQTSPYLNPTNPRCRASYIPAPVVS